MWRGARLTYAALVEAYSPLTSIGLAPSGYVQALNTVPQDGPVLAVRDPAVGAFVRDTGVPSTILTGVGPVVRYVPAWSGDGRIGRGLGRLAIGSSPISYTRASHGLLEMVVQNGLPVYVEVV